MLATYWASGWDYYDRPQRRKVMSEALGSKTDSGHPLVYQIRVQGHLGSHWTEWFGGLTVTLEDNGITLLTGPVDQAALHGLLKKVRDLGMPLVSVVQKREANDPRETAGLCRGVVE
jgi:hypothetical protein